MKKMSRPIRKVNAYVVGLDVHARQITYCMLNRRGDEVASGALRADARDLDDFCRKHIGRKKAHFALEASGYSLWIYDWLCQRYATERVHLASAKKIRAIANSRRKNDANDAYWLAHYTHEGRLPEAWVPIGKLREVRTATRCRRWAVRRKTALMVRLRSLLAQRGVRIAHRFDSGVGRSKAEAVARNATGIWGAALRDHLDELDAQIERIRAWDERLKALAKAMPEIGELQDAIPGIGPVLAAVVIAESGPIRRFDSAKEYGSYTGLAPSDRSSGGKQRHGAISREGSAHLRWALQEAVVACQKAKRGPAQAVGDWVRRRAPRMGHVQKARCAAARKLAETIWRYYTYGEHFDAARAFSA